MADLIKPEKEEDVQAQVSFLCFDNLSDEVTSASYLKYNKSVPQSA